MLEFRNVVFQYDSEDFNIIDGLSFHLEKGEFVSVIGPSGCGKSTIFRLTNQLLPRRSGEILVDGRSIDGRRGYCGYMPQRDLLFPWRTVNENLRLPMEIRGGISRAEMDKRAAETLEHVGLAGWGDKRPEELSGGMRQRAAFARTLLTGSELLLLDEPFSALDAYLKWQVELELSDILKNLSCGTLFVTHNRDEVYRLCDTVCVLNKGKSDPKETVKELFRAPATMGAALISGCKNVSAAEVKQGETLFCKDWNVTLKTALHVPENIAYVGVRAHYFTTEGTENAIPCTVERVVENPFSTVVMLQTTGAGRLRWELDKAVWETLSGTEKLTLYVRPEDVMPLTE